DAAGNHLNYTTSTHAFSCGTTASAGTVTINSYTSGSNTWNKPATCNTVVVLLWGAGGGGGGGSGNATGNGRVGGGGGGGGAFNSRTFRCSDLGSSETAVAGAG